MLWKGCRKPLAATHVVAKQSLQEESPSSKQCTLKKAGETSVIAADGQGKSVMRRRALIILQARPLMAPTCDGFLPTNAS